MGEKGSPAGTAGEQAAEALLDDLQPVGHVTSKKMFGGYGIFCGGLMFAIVDPTGAFFLRADESSRPAFEAEGAQRHSRMPYWEIPARVREDPERLLGWARAAIDGARAAKK